MNLVPLFEEALEFQDYNGTVLSDGKVAVYYIGRTRLADIYEDVAAEYPAENPRILNNLGMGPVYVNPAFDYEMVVYDAYGSELFSVKKYLASKGEHSTANVVVTPSESIAVSAWTVGDVQVYMPYLTGQLGKVYEGIDPIVVNNQVDKISANHVPLGVQDPLYFVQDDEEGCIIGFSGETLPEGTMNESAFGYEDGQITSYNGSAFSAGLNYEAGTYVDIDGNTINVTGLQPAGNYQSAGDYVVHDELSSYATQDWVNEQGFLTAIPSEYVTENTLQSGLSSKLDSTAFSAVSGDFLTAHQSLDGLMSADLLEISDNKITGYNGTAFAGQGGVTGDYELVAGSGVELVDDPDAHTTTINVTAEGTPVTAIEEMIDSATSALFPNSAVTPLVNSIFANTVNYQSKPSADAIYAGQNTLANVGQIVGLNNSNFYIVPSGTLQVPKIITAYDNGLTAAGVLTASNYDGLILSSQSVNFSSNFNGLTNSATGSYFSAGILGLYNSGDAIVFSANNTGLSLSGYNNYFSAGRYGIYNLVEGYPSLFISGGAGKIDINLTGGSAIDNYGNKKWQIGEADHLWSFAGGNPSYTGRPIVLCYSPQTGSANAPYFIAGPGGFTSEYIQNNNVLGLYGDFGNGIRYTNQINKVTATLNANDIQYNRYNTATSATDAWSLIGSVQKREIEYDADTSAITAIAGSAIGGGGGGVPQSAFDELKQSYDALSALFAQYSGQWLLPNEGEE